MNQPISVCIQVNNLHVISQESEEWNCLSFIAILNSFLAFPTAALNALVIFAILSTRSLATPSHILLAGLAATDLLVGLVSQPLHVAMTLNYRDGRMECYCYVRAVASFVYGVSGATSIMTVTAISLDRYLAIRLKIMYKTIVTVRRVKIVVLFIWAVAIFISTLPFFVSPLATSAFAAFGVLLCLTTTIVFYALLFVSLKKHCVQVSPQANQNAESLKKTFNITKYKALLKTMLIVLFFMICCYSFMAGSLAVITNADKSRSTQWALLTVVGLNSTFNPVIYITRMKELQKACVKKFRKCLSSRGRTANFTNRARIVKLAEVKPVDCNRLTSRL